MPELAPLVSVIMGSTSDWGTMKPCAETLDQFGVPHECRVMSAHRTPDLTAEYVSSAEGSRDPGDNRGLPAERPTWQGYAPPTLCVPVLGVPMPSVLDGVDSLLSTVQMPGGIPVGTLAIGKAGAKNAALLAIAILATNDESLRAALKEFRRAQAEKVRSARLD